MARGSMGSVKFLWLKKLEFVLNFILVQYLCIYLICFYLLNLLNNWTRSHFGSSGFAWSVFALPPSPVCLLCSVLSTGTFAVMIACTLPSGLLGSCLCGKGGRKDGLHPCIWLRVNLLIHCGLFMEIYWSPWKIFFKEFYIAISCYVHPLY